MNLRNFLFTCGINLAILLTFTGGHVIAADIYVPRDYPTIQKAIDAAVDGDVIHIAAGVYRPTKTIDIGGKALTLLGAQNPDGSASTLIDGSGTKKPFDSIQILKCDGTSDDWVALENLVLRNGYAHQGAGLYNAGRKLQATNVEFRSNQAVTGGGGIFNQSSEHLVFTDCIFFRNQTGNTEARGGAGMFNQFCKLIEFNDCEFEENSVPNSDGAIGGGMLNEACSLILSDCVFKENKGFGENFAGAGIANLECTMELTRCSFLGNQTPLSHAGIYNVCSELNLRDCAFKNNHGAIKSSFEYFVKGIDPSVNISNCIFENNMTGNQGGAIDHYRGRLSLVGSVFVGNNATELGGALCCNDCILEIDDCEFNNNFTGYDSWIGDVFHVAIGGAVYLNELESGSIVNSVFENNLARGNADSGSGGALYVSHTETLNVMQSEFRHNTARSHGGSGYGPIGKDGGGEGFGGAVFVEFSGPTFQDCSFVNNQAIGVGGYSAMGGSLYSYESVPVLMNCSFAGNRAESDGSKELVTGFGGAVCNINSQPVLSNCDIRNNVALGNSTAQTSGYGGGIYNQSSAAVIEGCCVKANIACYNSATEERGGGIFNDANSDFTTVENSVVCGNWMGQITGRYIDLGGNTIDDQCQISDINCDGIVDGADLTILLGFWGTDEPVADLNHDGIVDGADLTILLGDWS